MDIALHGVMNSLFIALMPTVSTSVVLGNSESFELHKNFVYRHEGSGIRYNFAAVRALREAGLLTEDLVGRIVENGGSLAGVDGVPDAIQKRFPGAFKISQKFVIDLCADRAPFVDQSMSMNLAFAATREDTVQTALVYAWERGLKTGLYYLRRLPSKTISKKSSLSESPACSRALSHCDSCSS